MRAPSRSSLSFKDTISDFPDPLSKGEYKFLVRLLDDDDKCIDRIWRSYVDKGLPDNAANRTTFIRMLCIMWDASERAVRRAARVDWERAVDEWHTAVMELVAKAILEKGLSSEDKVCFTNWASEVLKKDAEYRAQDKGTNNFLSGDGPLLNIRSNHTGSRQRTAFMRVASTYFHQTMGQWHDVWVVDLTNVAFPDHVTDRDMVRSARRGIRS
jgi:hypothetical protein